MQLMSIGRTWAPEGIARGRTAILLAGLVMLSGCASIRAAQDPIKPADLLTGICPTPQERKDFFEGDASRRAGLRDEMIAGCAAAITDKYMQFTGDLRTQSVSVESAIDIATVGLSAGATLVKEKAARQMSAGSAFLGGAGKAISKDVFYDQALPAVVKAMDAKRDTILAGIIAAQRADPRAETYTIANAGYDLRRLQEAGNLVTAIADVTTKLGNEAAIAKDRLDVTNQGVTVELALPTALLGDDIATRRNAILARINSLDPSKDLPKLDAALSALGMTLDPKVQAISDPKRRFDGERAVLKAEIMKRVGVGDLTEQAGAMSKLEAALKPLF